MDRRSSLRAHLDSADDRRLSKGERQRKYDDLVGTYSLSQITKSGVTIDPGWTHDTIKTSTSSAKADSTCSAASIMKLMRLFGNSPMTQMALH